MESRHTQGMQLGVNSISPRRIFQDKQQQDTRPQSFQNAFQKESRGSSPLYRMPPRAQPLTTGPMPYAPDDVRITSSALVPNQPTKLGKVMYNDAWTSGYGDEACTARLWLGKCRHLSGREGIAKEATQGPQYARLRNV